MADNGVVQIRAGAADLPVRSSGPSPASAIRQWLARRLSALLAGVGLIVVGMLTTTVGPRYFGKTEWALPDDLWGTLTAANHVLRLNLSGLYTKTGLISFPGAAVILVPVVAVINAAGLGLAAQSTAHPEPAAWLVAGPYEIAISCLALLAADALAERLGVPRLRRAVLAVAGAVALWNVAVRWGHPEDAVAVALLLFAFGALWDEKASRAGWLVGAAVAVQPLVLLAVPVVLVIVAPRRMAGFLARAATPPALLLATAAAANWRATIRAVISQPNWPRVDHVTPWLRFAPHLGNGAVGAGPARELAVLLACGCALGVGFRRRIADRVASRQGAALAELLWWAAVALAIRCAFEPVMVAFYLWPALAVALVAASVSLPRLAGAAMTASVITFVSQVSWPGPWLWWGSMLAGLGLTLAFASPPMGARAAASSQWQDMEPAL